MAMTGTTPGLTSGTIGRHVAAVPTESAGLRPSMELLMTLHLELTKPVVMANGVRGARVFEGIIAGTAIGPRTSASVSSHSGCIDTVVREDGWCEMELRLLLATDDHALISIRSTGVADVGPHSQPTMAMRFEAGQGDHAWLNRVQAIAIGTRGRDEITYEVFTIS